MNPLLVLAGGYLLGSIPFSFLVARFFGVADVRTVGSGNVGATNVARTAGKGPGLVAFILDAGKGAAAVALAARFAASPWPVLAGALAVLGHMFSPWLGWKGGKGVATGAGVFLPIAPWAVAAALAAFAMVLAVTRMVSLGSVAGCLVLATAMFVLRGPVPESLTAAAVVALIVWKHKGNLARVARREERRLGSGGS